jgi:DNA-binding response OmpR family regulator
MNAGNPRGRPLSNCVACLVAETPGQRKTLETLVTRTGFGGLAIDEAGIGYPAETDRRLPYFFFHSLVPDGLLREGIAKIRTDERHRFCPAMLIIGECSMNDVLRYISLGFDDIVTLPEAARVLERRFAHQLGTQFSYFETATYFGPDRRRAKRNGDADEQKRPGEFRYVRYLIQRAPTGVEILRREVLLSSNSSASPPPRPVATSIGING